MKLKYIKHLALSVLLVLSLMTTALAAEVPVNLVVENLNGQQRIVKTYELPPGTDPETLKEPSCDYDGFSLSKKSAEGQTFSYKRGKMEQGEKNDGKGKNGAGRGGSGGYREPGATRTPAAQGGQSGRVQETI